MRMFIGHYGVSFAAKGLVDEAPLPGLLLAVQGLDILFAVFVLTGLEPMRITPGFTARTPCSYRPICVG